MNLDEYLSQSPPPMSAEQLTKAINAASSAQIRQWRYGARDRRPGARQPSPRYAMAIETATGGKVHRWDLRPYDWHQIWPGLVGTPGAPPVPAKIEKAT